MSFFNFKKYQQPYDAQVTHDASIKKIADFAAQTEMERQKNEKEQKLPFFYTILDMDHFHTFWNILF